MNLKKIRNKCGLTQTQVAKKLGIAQVTYCNYELGNREPDISTVIKLADIFEVSIDELFGYSKENTNEEPISRDERFIIENLKLLSNEEIAKLKKYIKSCISLKLEEKSL